MNREEGVDFAASERTRAARAGGHRGVYNHPVCPETHTHSRRRGGMICRDTLSGYPP